MSLGDCVICCERLNISTRKAINCNFCEYSTCRACFQKYITETLLDPHCMNCKKVFSNDFLNDNCTGVFITKTLKSHRENVLLEREKALLQETQPYVVVENQRRAIDKQVSLLYARKQELRRQERLVEQEIADLYHVRHTLNVGDIPVTDERRKFVRKCPIENCRGFLSTQWKCGSCEKRICNKCNEENGDNHECLPENVASMELLNKDTKPCPNCGTMIFKISGCSQIWCVDCHTAWDWNTSRVVSGVIHNPHYYEFIRNGGNGGRNHGDIPCGGLPTIDEIHTRLISVYNVRADIPPTFYLIHQCITHIENHEIRNADVDTVAFNRSLRVKYLMNELNENDFKIVLQQNERRRQKMAAFHNLYRMFIDVASDILRQVVVFIRENRSNRNECAKFINENITIINNLVGYFNESFQKVGKIYKCVYPGITNDHHFVTNIETAIRRTINRTN